MLYYEASTNLKAPVSTSASTVPSTGGDVISKQGPNPLPFPATPQDSSSYRPDNLRWHRSQLSTDRMIFQVHTSSIIIFLQDSSHNDSHNLQTPPSPSHLAQTAQLGRLEKRFTGNETAQPKADRCTPAYCYMYPSQHVTTPIVASLSPSHHQWKAVRT